MRNAAVPYPIVMPPSRVFIARDAVVVRSEEPGDVTVSVVLRALEGRRNMLLETRKRDGSWVGTAVHLVVEGDHVFFRTWSRSGKAKRLRNFSEVRFAPSTARGRRTGPPLAGRATLLHQEDARRAATMIDRRYPIMQGVGVRLLHRIMRYETQHYVITDVVHVNS
jgi:PPOX class probable F420-dependent enzyme